MAFWNAEGADPKRKFRWYLQFGSATGTGDGPLQLAAKKIDKPKFEISTTPHKFINHTFFFPGRLEWKPITVTFADIGGPDSDIAKILFDRIKEAGYEVPKLAIDCRKSITKDNSVKAFGSNFVIIQTDGNGKPVESWSLQNPWISTIEFGDLDYTSEDLIEITMTIVYDSATRF